MYTDSLHLSKTNSVYEPCWKSVHTYRMKKLPKTVLAIQLTNRTKSVYYDNVGTIFRYKTVIFTSFDPL